METNQELKMALYEVGMTYAELAKRMKVSSKTIGRKIDLSEESTGFLPAEVLYIRTLLGKPDLAIEVKD